MKINYGGRGIYYGIDEVNKYLDLAVGDTRMTSVLANEVDRLRLEVKDKDAELTRLRAELERQKGVVDAARVNQAELLERAEKAEAEVAALREAWDNARNACLRRDSEIEEWEECRKAVAALLDADPQTWPSHGNGPLAVAAVVAVKQNEVAALKAEIASWELAAKTHAEARDYHKTRADKVEAELASLKAGKCACWQEPGSTERQHTEHCPEAAKPEQEGRS